MGGDEICVETAALRHRDAVSLATGTEHRDAFDGFKGAVETEIGEGGGDGVRRGEVEFDLHQTAGGQGF